MPRIERTTRKEIRTIVFRLRQDGHRLTVDSNAQGCAIEDDSGRRLTPRTNPRMLKMWLDGFEEALRSASDPHRPAITATPPPNVCRACRKSFTPDQEAIDEVKSYYPEINTDAEAINIIEICKPCATE
jgi:hypothetical protein